MNAPSPLVATLHVALGGAIGSVLRYQLGRAMTHWLGAAGGHARFPWATLAVNVIGSLAMGLLAGWLARHGDSGGEHCGCCSASACSAGSPPFPPSASN